MQYYLDTNTIYNLKKLPREVVDNSFYSVFGLIEIIAGLNHKEFQRRKSVLDNLIRSSAQCDYSFPEKILLEAFDYFTRYDFTEERSEELFRLIDDIIASDSFASFQVRSALGNKVFGFDQVIRTDRFYTTNFLNASVKGHSVISETLAERGKKTVTLGGTKFDLSSRKELGNFLDDTFINESFTLLSLTQTAMHIAKLEGEDIQKEIFESYNGRLAIFVRAFSAYSKDQVTEQRRPARNDFQDLLHLYYLRNSAAIKIVTNDKLFYKYVPENCIKLEGVVK